jgi:hypothetical protein
MVNYHNYLQVCNASAKEYRVLEFGWMSLLTRNIEEYITRR